MAVNGNRPLGSHCSASSLTAVMAFGLLLLGFATATRSAAEATDGAVTDRTATGSSAGKPTTVSDQETETVALSLVELHLPELRGVLPRLKTAQPREYQRAIRDLARSARKLESAKNRDERLFDIELETLQAQNQVTLLTARLKVRDSEGDRRRLQTAVQRLHEAQIARARYEVDLYQQRLQRTEQLLQSAQQRLQQRQTNADQQLQKTYHTLLKKAGREPPPPDSSP